MIVFALHLSVDMKRSARKVFAGGGSSPARTQLQQTTYQHFLVDALELHS